ncbi:hypothetical protein EMQ25_11445 [Arsenicitalea aurantiaca]|uniref:Helix-turn-helix domain-containing protein n=1 Tax=Arsenicitalea aurantiaca TaxID=1783274 RepID=A0A433X7C4_9HYPH|nr:hypothetical protein [Arsenicitalea aurantiaca]RUT29950.1 hypothetical protein EMQ25_11445 [Arsenicitalea aurantiaca]
MSTVDREPKHRRRGPNFKHTAETDRFICDSRKAAVTFAAIAETLGISTAAVVQRARHLDPGTESLRSGRYIRATPEQVSILGEMVDEGATLAAIGQRLGVGPDTIRAWLDASGFASYRRRKILTEVVGGQDKRRRFAHTAETDRVIVDSLAAGKTFVSMADALGTTRRVVRARVRFLQAECLFPPPTK